MTLKATSTGHGITGVSKGGRRLSVGTTSIGGIPIGTQGTTGIYPGYTMAGGDDFNEPLNVVHTSAPLSKYFTTHVYGNGARSVSGLLARSYDIDPYHTGSQDSNRGSPVGSTN